MIFVSFFFFSFSLRKSKCNIIIYLNFCNYLHLSFQMTDKSDLRGRSIQFLSLETRQQVFWYGKKHRELKDWNEILVYWIEKDFNFRIYCSRNPFLFPICISYIFVCLFSFSRQIPKVIQVEKIRQKYYFKFKRKKINDSL